MTDQDPRPDVVPEAPPMSGTAPVSPAATSFEAATAIPAEPETRPDLAPPASFTVPQQEPVAPAPSDKLWVHFVWEGLLLVLIALGVAAFFLFGPSGGLGSPDRVAVLLAGATPFLLFAMALGMSMRVGSVNLSVVHLGLLSMTLFASMADQPLIVAIGVVAGAMAAAGVLLALLVTVFKAPGWAASLLVAMAAWFLVTQRELPIFGPVGEPPAPSQVELETLVGWLVIAGVVVLSIAGGLIGIMRPVRETLGGCVDAVEQRGKRTPAAFATTWAALIGSCLMAGVAGYLVMLPTGANLSIAVVNANGLAPLLTGLGIVLIGGTSARGRRGGVFGTLLAAVVVFMAALLLENLDGSWIVNYAIPFGVLLLGLLVNWLMDLVNRPRPAGAVPPYPAAMAPMFVPAGPGPIAVEPMPEAPVYPEPIAETVPASPYVAAEPAELPPAHVEAPTAVDTTQELPADANPYLYRPPAG